ncbi:hypothetical protein SBA1_1980003 [Candidatus Sulfotelmatobacter kueseliae]|uniref:Uncharacterized protein n=1 Tax=Candidatus Sulfotelmatobacter kueseliae TaxID=2042962 RepID=A0A2U3KF92_9BACT|nr:hypothetical protein SBA1_1980003 [Candidatus Sulfotelmatobacter kueseliae]
MVKVQDENGSGKIDSHQFPNPGRPIADKNDFRGLSHSAPLGFLAQEQPKIGRSCKTAEVGGGVFLSHRMPLGIHLGLQKHTTQLGFPGFGRSIGLFAFAPGQFLLAHGHAGAVARHIHERAFRLVLPGLEPRRHSRSHLLHQTLDLTVADLDPGILKEVLAGFCIRVFSRRAIHHPRQRRSVGAFQTQGGIGRTMAPGPLTIIVAQDVNGAEKSGDLQVAALHQPLWDCGLESSVKLVHHRLDNRLEQLAGRLENQGPKLLLEDQQALLARRLIQELLDISSGFLLERRLDFVPFFFESVEASARVMATVASTNCPANCSNFLRPSMALARAGAFSGGMRRLTLRPSSQI